jgi:hypothetical protein
LSAATLFGAPLGYTGDELENWISDLERVWMMFSGTPVATLDEDLDRLGKVFSGASGRSLRSAFAELPDAGTRVQRLPEQVALQSDGRSLITPEGRILLEVLHRLRAGGLQVIDRDGQLGALTRAVEARGGWYAAWARRQLSGTLSPPVLGAAIFLVVNGSIGRPFAFRMPVDEAADKQLGALVLPIVGGFSVAMGGKSPPTDAGIQSNWVFTQVSRFLTRDVAREGGDFGTDMYVREGRESALLTNLRRRLAKYSGEQRRYALQELATSYREARGALLAAGVSHEEPVHTRRVLAQLSDED